MSDTEVRTIDIKLQIQGEDKHPTGVSININTNDLPMISLNHHTGEDAYKQAISMTSKDVAEDMGKAQTTMFSERTSPDVTIKVDDGADGSIKWKGFIATPKYSFSSYAVDRSDIALPEFAKLDSLTFACYQELPTPGIDILAEVKYTASLPEFIYTCANALVEHFSEIIDTDKGNDKTLSMASRKAQHNLNKKVLPLFKELLDNSKDTFGWEELKDVLEDTSDTPDAPELKTRIYAILTSSGGSFFTTIRRLAEDFQAMYVPDIEGKIGKIVSKEKLFNDVKECKLNIIASNFSVGNYGLFPIRFVGTSGDITSPIDVYKSQSMFIAYPEDNIKIGGSALVVPPPAWLPRSTVNLGLDDAGYDEEAMSVSTVNSTNNAAKKETSKLATNSAKLLQKWVKCEYLWQSLGNSSAAITTPLDLSIKTGVRYKVSNSNGDPLFTGFLYSLAHDISCSGNSMSATSRLGFTHVEMEGFSLKGK